MEKTSFTEFCTHISGISLLMCMTGFNCTESCLHSDYCFSQRNSSPGWDCEHGSLVQFMTIKNATRRVVYSLSRMPQIAGVKWEGKGIHLSLERNSICCRYEIILFSWLAREIEPNGCDHRKIIHCYDIRLVKSRQRLNIRNILIGIKTKGYRMPRMTKLGPLY